MRSSNRCGLSGLGLVGRALGIVAVLYMLSNSATAIARPIFFRYMSVADTSQHFFSRLNFPCLNDLSRIAFTGTLSSGIEGVFSRVNLGGFDTLADSGTSGYEGFGLDCSINHNAMIEFTALKKVSDGYNTVVLRGSGSSASPLIDTTGTYRSFSGFQLSLVGKSALGAVRASDDATVLLVRGSGALTGPERVIAPGTGAISQYSTFATNPTINSSGTVAFAAFKSQNHTVHILTVDESNLVTQLLNDEGPFVGVGDAVINDTGSIAFNGTLAGGEHGVWRLDQVNGLWFIKQLASSNTSPCVQFNAVALNDLDAVTFACRDFNSNSYVYLSDQHGLHLVLGPGSQLLGRTVNQANIGREAVNSDKHIAILVDFDDGSSAIVRADPTYIPPWLVSAISGAFQLSVSADSKSGPSISTPVNTRPKLMVLSFDVAFPSHSGEVHVMLGDELLGKIAAPSRGVYQHVSLPIDLRKKLRTATATKQLRFELAGKSSATVQISNVLIPGVISDSMNSDPSKRWHIDTSKGGRASTVDTSAFPVGVNVLSNGRTQTANRPASIAILSSEGFDATHDIDQSTLTFNGASPETDTKQNATATNAPCSARDVNDDKLPDLVCDVVLPANAKAMDMQPVSVRAVSTYGWVIAGSSTSDKAAQ